MEDSKYLFALYAQEDYEQVDDIFLELFKKGISVKSLKDAPKEGVKKAISGSSAVLFVISRISTSSQTLMYYVQFAKSMNKHIVPYLLEPPDSAGITRSILMNMDESASIPAYEYAVESELAERAYEELKLYFPEGSSQKKSKGLTLKECLIIVAVLIGCVLGYKFYWIPKQQAQVLENIRNSTVMIYAADIVLNESGEQKIQLYSQGSGFIIDDKGRIATNNHVIEDGKVYLISSPGVEDQYYPALLLEADPNLDLAILQIDDDDFEVTNYLNLSDKAAETEDRLYVSGYPSGIDLTISEGIVSYNSHQVAGAYGNFYLVTAAVSQGSSGGPAVDEKGNVIGIATARYSTADGVNLIRPVSYLREMYKKIA